MNLHQFPLHSAGNNPGCSGGLRSPHFRPMEPAVTNGRPAVTDRRYSLNPLVPDYGLGGAGAGAWAFAAFSFCTCWSA